MTAVLSLCGLGAAHAADTSAPTPEADRAGQLVGTFTFGSEPVVTADVDQGPTSVPPGGPFSLSATARADEAATVGWEVSRDGTAWEDMPGAGTAETTPTTTVGGVGQPGTTVATLEIDAPAEPGTYFYRAQFNNTLGSAATSVAQVDVSSPVNVPGATIVANPKQIVADGSAVSTILVSLADSSGAPVSGREVHITTTAGSLGETTDQHDGSYTAELVAPTTPGEATLRFTVDGAQAPASAKVELIPGDPSPTGSTLTADPTSITADGESTSQITATVVDDRGNPLPGHDVAIATTSGDLTATTDNDDGTYTAALTAPGTTGSATLTFTIDAQDASASTTVVFTAGEASLTGSTIAADPSSVTADGRSTSSVTVTLVDDRGNRVPGRNVGVTSTAGTVTPAQDQGDGTYTATLTAPTAAGATTLAFSADGQQAPVTATVAFTAGEASLTGSTITADPLSITADGRSTAAVRMLVVDEHDNPVPGLDVVPTTTSGTITPAQDEGDGVYTATLTSPVTAGATTLGFAISGREAASTATVELAPGPVSPSISTIGADPTSVTADGESTSRVTVTALDTNSNAVPGRDVRVVSTDGSITRTTDNGDGTYTATLTSSTTAGVATLTFTVDGQDAENTAIVTFTAGQTSLTDSTITADPTTITADGESTTTVTVQAIDANGNGVPDRDVHITTSAGSISEVTPGPDGTYAATLRSSTTAGHAVVGFTIDDQSAPRTAEVTFAPGPVDLTSSEIGADPTSIVADGESTSTITVTVRDEHANLVAGRQVDVRTSAGAITPATDRGDGTYVATLTAPTTSGAAVESFAVDGQESAVTTTVALNAGDASTTRSTISADPTAIEADGEARSVITATVLDEHGNGVAGRVVHVTTTAGTISATEDQQDGTYTAVLTAPTTAGTATVAFTIDGRLADDAVDVELTAGEAVLADASIGADPTSIPADGLSTSTVTARLGDRYGNPVPGQDVQIATTEGSIGGTTDQGDGSYTATLVSSTSPGSATLSFTVGGMDAPATTPVAFTARDDTLSSSTITAAPGSIVADGESTAEITVTVLGSDGAPVPGRDVVVTSTDGSISPTVDHGDGTHTASLRSPIRAGRASVAFTIDGRVADATAEVAFVAGEASHGASSITADPTSIEADGTSTSTLTVRVLDAHANPVTGRDVAITTTSGRVSPTTDQGDGTYTATLTSSRAPGAARAGFMLDGREARAATMVAFTRGLYSDGSGVLDTDESSRTGESGHGARAGRLPVTGAEVLALLATVLACAGTGAILVAARRTRRDG